jgi:hypothetical protein
VTVHYRWHPLFGQTLRVHRRIQRGEQLLVFCVLPDGTVGALPSWMMDPACAQYALDEPFLAVEALIELRALLDALQATSGCGKSSLRSLRGGAHGARKREP